MTEPSMILNLNRIKNLLLDMNRKRGIDCPELREAYEILTGREIS